MTFLFPLGLLGLIGIPVLILIYIIKSKYAEQTVASTYLWTLSERFLKRKRPISPLAGLVSLFLQILTVTVISLLIARPILTVKNAAHEYCFLLDSSGSMQMTEGDATRFEKAKAAIAEKIEDAASGSIFSLIQVGDVTTTVFEKTVDKEQALELLSALSGSHTAADYTDALAVSQGYFNENNSVLTYLFTDTSYQNVTNIEVVNVSGQGSNSAMTAVNWELSGGEVILTGKLQGFGTAASVTLTAYADDSEAPLVTAPFEITAGEPTPFELRAPLKNFAKLRLVLTATDALSLDNEHIIYNVKSEDTYSILLVTETPNFIETALAAVGHTRVDVMKPADFNSGVRGYGLYIFECCVPAVLPDDGTVWFFDPTGSVPDAGFSVQGEVALAAGEALTMTDSTSSVAAALTKNISGEKIIISEYVKCSPYRSFTTLFSYKGNPIIFAGTNAKGHRQVVFAFDLHHSDFALQVDYVILMHNLIGYSFPSVLEKVDHYVGEKAAVNVIANCDSIRVDSPSGEVTYLDVDAAAVDFLLTEVGSYTVTVTTSGIPHRFYMYAALPEAERVPLPVAETIGLQGEAGHESFNGTFDPTTILFICLALLFLADWMVYCYEKYQLR